MRNYQKEIRQLLQANKLIEKFAQRLEKTEIGAFHLYRACGEQMKMNAERIERLKSEAFEIAENDAEYYQAMSEFS